MPDTTNLNLLWTSLLVEELVRLGIRHFCLSPGSRSAPLAVALARQAGVKVLIAYDERAAAFYALGCARATAEPTVLVCTSGTALAHYLPALIEASQDQVPMLILSADRPPELLDAGANQAIRQDGLYGNYVRWQLNLPCPSSEIPPQWLLTTVDQAHHRALHPIPGPVHLNLAFREPLDPVNQSIPDDYLKPIQTWLGQDRPYTHISTSAAIGIDDQLLDSVIELIQQTQTGLLILGRLHGSAREAVIPLANSLGWPVFADVLSDLSLNADLMNLVPHYDQLLADKSFAAACRPETVIQFGGNFVSGRLLKHLAAHPPRAYVHLTQRPERLDPNHQVSLRLCGDLAAFCADLILYLDPDLAVEPAWTAELKQMAGQAGQVYAELDQQTDLSEPGVARLLTRLTPAQHTLMLGNSLPVREVDGFAAPRLTPMHVFGNRGTSGIDGHVATAAGYAEGSQAPLTLLCGDLTLFHDLNSLHLLSRIDTPVIVVVINNGGGGIFSFLPIAAHTELFEPWFGTPHSLDFAHAARQFGLPYFAPSSQPELATCYLSCLQAQVPALIEVRTQREQTLALHRNLQQKVTERLRHTGP